MTTDHPESGEQPDAEQIQALRQGSAALSAAAKHAQQAMESAKGIVSQAHLDEVGAKAAAAASNLYRESRDRLAGNEELSQAAEQLGAAIRKNPLAAVGIAFSAGLLLALLTRG
jgi:ElaB/YqjD/DUF883 family membrane-anchored ribosome-binding protein